MKGSRFTRFEAVSLYLSATTHYIMLACGVSDRAIVHLALRALHSQSRVVSTTNCATHFLDAHIWLRKLLL